MIDLYYQQYDKLKEDLGLSDDGRAIDKVVDILGADKWAWSGKWVAFVFSDPAKETFIRLKYL